jgi:hypothetical protein
MDNLERQPSADTTDQRTGNRRNPQQASCACHVAAIARHGVCFPKPGSRGTYESAKDYVRSGVGRSGWDAHSSDLSFCRR